jgi:hypothetical protein
MFTHEYRRRSSRVVGKAWDESGAMSEGLSYREVHKPDVNIPALTVQE